MITVIVFQETFNAILQLFWEMCTLWKLREDSKFLLELCRFYVNRIEYTCQVADCEGVKTDTNDHPNESGNFLIGTTRGNITIAHRCESL